jgi:hypothetical protein
MLAVSRGKWWHSRPHSDSAVGSSRRGNRRKIGSASGSPLTLVLSEARHRDFRKTRLVIPQRVSRSSSQKTEPSAVVADLNFGVELSLPGLRIGGLRSGVVQPQDLIVHCMSEFVPEPTSAKAGPPRCAWFFEHIARENLDAQRSVPMPQNQLILVPY